MRLHKLVAVLHSGTDGERGNPRREQRYTDILGNITFMNAYKVEIGQHLELIFADDTEYVSRGVVVDRKFIRHKGKNMCDIETEGTIYRFLVLS